MDSIKIGFVQMNVTEDKQVNIKNMESKVRELAGEMDIVVLPEFWNSPYDVKLMPKYAEKEEESESLNKIIALSAELELIIVGGTIPEQEGDSYFNTCYAVKGKILAKHRKMHLFDIDIPGKIKFKESEILSGGDSFSWFDTAWGRIGLGICYDIRFGEHAQVLSREFDCKLLLYPAAFNTVTGPVYWSALQQGRAVDCQCYVASCSPARIEEEGKYHAYGHSMVVSPEGEIIKECGHEETTMTVELPYFERKVKDHKYAKIVLK